MLRIMVGMLQGFSCIWASGNVTAGQLSYICDWNRFRPATSMLVKRAKDIMGKTKRGTAAVNWLTPRMQRDVLLMLIAAVATGYILTSMRPRPVAEPAVVVPPTVQAIATLPSLRPAGSVTTGPNIYFYNPGTEGYSITTGEARGVHELSVRTLGDHYVYGIEFMADLRRRDPEVYAWAAKDMYRREAERIASDNATAREFGTREHTIAGETSWGRPVKVGESIIFPDVDKRTPAEREQYYQDCYSVVKMAYLEAGAKQRAHELYRQRLEETRPSAAPLGSN